jgi:hypothetical protein
MIALFLALQFYTVIYYGLFGFVVVGLVGGVGWLAHVYPTMRVRWLSLGAIAGGIALALILCLPLAIPYYRVSQLFGFERTLDEAWPFSASLEMWTTAPMNSLVYGALFGKELPRLGFYEVDTLFPGLLLLFVAACGLITWLVAALGLSWGGKSRLSLKWPLLTLLGIAFFFLLSLGPYPQIESLQPDFDTLLPYAWIHEWVPGFQALRAPGRFAIVVFLGLGIMAAYLFQKVRWRPLQGVLLLLLLIEPLNFPATPLFTPSITAGQQAVYDWLAEQPQSAFVELPVYPFGQEGEEAHWLESQFQSMRHWQRTPVGYSGFFPPRYEELLRWLSDFPRPKVVQFLRALGVQWVVLHRDRLPEEQRVAIEGAIQELPWETQAFGDIAVVQLPPLDVAQPTQRFYIPGQAQAGGMMAFGTILTSETPTPVVLGSELGHLRVEWWQGEERVLEVEKVVQPPYFVDRIAVATLLVPAPEAAGEYRLRLFRSEGGQELASGVVNVVFDVAPPEPSLVPLEGIEAEIVCDDGSVQIRVLMRTIGWYDDPFTLSARLIDGSGAEVGRSTADVEFGVELPRSNLLNSATYEVPLESVPAAELGPLSVDLIAYRWQQEAERVVPRFFVAGDGTVVDALRLPLPTAATCGQ